MSARYGFGIAVGVVATAMSFASAASAMATGRMSEAWLPLVFFALASISLLGLVHRRQRGEVAIELDHVNRLKLGAVLIIVFGMLMGAGLIAFALAESIWNHAYGWLLLIPLAAWGLRQQVRGIGKIVRASPDDPEWPRSGGVPL